MGKLANTFTERQEFTKYFGVTGVKIVEDEKGMPIINPDNATMAKLFDGYNTDKDERVYTGTTKLGWGWTDFKERGGKKRVSQKEYDELAPSDRESVVVEDEVTYAKVTLVVETLDALKMKKLLTFRFMKAKSITKKGDKVKVFNKFGKTTYVAVDGAFGSEKFEHGDDDGVHGMPFSTGHLDFEDLINFLYAYSTLNRKVALVEDLDVDAMLEGDMSSLEELISIIHEDIRTADGKSAYGSTLLMTVENNNSTRNEFRQSYYPVFERWYLDNNLTVNKEFSRILKSLAEERKPASNGKVYSAESKGIFVGHNGMPHLGLKEFKSSYTEKLMSGVINRQQAAATSKPTETDNPFGDGGTEDVNFF